MGIGKVNGYHHPLQQTNQASASDKPAPTEKVAKAREVQSENADHVELSEEAKQENTSAEVERLRAHLRALDPGEAELAEIKEKVEQGHYTSPESVRNIAERLAEELGR